MKFIAAIFLVVCIFAVSCHGIPIERETLWGVEQLLPAVPDEQPEQLTRVARHHHRGYGGGYGGYGGYGGGYPGIGGYGGGYPGIGGYGGGYPGYGGGYPGGGASSSNAYASASSGSNSEYYG